ncbi:MAG TPA: 50S ribosomal protein L25/general stress protein Ctc [Xanthomonadaceae bacterium]|jgi:large subunit ribosomal protein L25|nr:50S ribosomal protein L25/general stress protein Ctc [Xanthomonadaceae bacterium]
MAISHNITAQSRETQGSKGASRRLRHAGFIPAIVYGGHAEPKSVQFEHNPIWLASQHEWFYSSILSLDIDGNVERVLLRDMQRHPYKTLIMHMDFLRVSENEAIRISVPLHFLNQEKSPAGKAAGVVVTHELTEVAISCLPRDLPEFIEIDLAALEVGDIVHLSEIKLPNGVEIPELKLGKEHDVAVVIAKHAKEEVEEVPEVAADVPAIQVAPDAAKAAAADKGKDKK